MAAADGGHGQLPEELGLAVDAHVRYIQALDTKQDTLAYHLTAHLRLNGLYWGLTALHLLRHPSALPRQETIDFVLSCWDRESGGFGASPGHDAHMLYTCSAIQILATINALHALDTASDADGRPRSRREVATFIASLQDRSTGAFAGDEWGEQDTRFVYIAFNALSLLGLTSCVDVPLAVRYLRACENFDGGYGVSPGAESHAGQIFACVGAFAIAEKIGAEVEVEVEMDGGGKERRMEKVKLVKMVNVRKLAGWLSERQVGGGGLNGRPEKLEDVCYSWWVSSSLAMLGKLGWIDEGKLLGFILRCQDTENGGLADRPGNEVDVFHTCFGIAGLSLLGFEGLEEVDAVYCMPKKVIERVFEEQRAAGNASGASA